MYFFLLELVKSRCQRKIGTVLWATLYILVKIHPLNFLQTNRRRVSFSKIYSGRPHNILKNMSEIPRPTIFGDTL